MNLLNLILYLEMKFDKTNSQKSLDFVQNQSFKLECTKFKFDF